MVLPERLSASIGVGVTLGAMMSDQSRRKTRWELTWLRRKLLRRPEYRRVC